MRALARSGGTSRRACSRFRRSAACIWKKPSPSIASRAARWSTRRLPRAEVARACATARTPRPVSRPIGASPVVDVGAPGDLGLLVDEVLELDAALLEAGGVHVGQVVRHVVDVRLLRVHPAGGRVECANHLTAPSLNVVPTLPATQLGDGAAGRRRSSALDTPCSSVSIAARHLGQLGDAVDHRHVRLLERARHGSRACRSAIGVPCVREARPAFAFDRGVRPESPRP